MEMEALNEIDTILEEQLTGGNVDAATESNVVGFTEDHQFSWNRILADPKGDHGVFESRGDWYKTMKYEILHSGGFLRLFTLRGRVYWNGQNESEHTTPDWKLHFSCNLEHIGLAWNSLAALFIDMKCEMGMKVTTLNADQWSHGQRGREVTVYIYRYHHSYKDYMQGAVPEHDHDLYLGPELHDIYPAPFWYTFVLQAETRLAALGVQSRGVAEGDLALPGCRYASLRNEAYVKVPAAVNHHLPFHPLSSEEKEESQDTENSDDEGGEDMATTHSPLVQLEPPVPPAVELPPVATQLAYPPNDRGWNAARHPNPFLDVIFFLRERHKIIQGHAL